MEDGDKKALKYFLLECEQEQARSYVDNKIFVQTMVLSSLLEVSDILPRSGHPLRR